MTSAAAGRLFLVGVLAGCFAIPGGLAAQELTGVLIGTVRDEQGRPVAGAAVSLSSPALIGSPIGRLSGALGDFRFAALPPGMYSLDVSFTGFTPTHEDAIRIGASVTIARSIVLVVAGRTEAVVVAANGSGLDVRGSGFATTVAGGLLAALPTRRASMFDGMRSAPGISPTSPTSGVSTTVSAFGSGTNENIFLVDGTNTTCPCNGVARAEVGVDFIEEIQIQTAGASAEFGNFQGAVFNVITRQGSNRLLIDAAAYWQTSALTSRPVTVPYDAAGQTSGYHRAAYDDGSTTIGGPLVHDRLWFFGGYQHVRDRDSQPGTDPALPRRYRSDKTFGKLTWRLAPGWQLVQTLHDEWWGDPDIPTRAAPFEATLDRHGSVPAVTFGHLTYAGARRTTWDVRVGRFAYDQESRPATGDLTAMSQVDRATGITTGAPPSFGGLRLSRVTAKATLTHYWPGLAGADHQIKTGLQLERGQHEVPAVTPTGTRLVTNNGQPFQSISAQPNVSGGLFNTASAFLIDAVTVGPLTLDLGVRFDRNRAISQDLHAIDLEGRDTPEKIAGAGPLYTWNTVSPRVGMTARVSADGRTLVRGSYGRFSQGVLTGEIGPFHPGNTVITTTALDPRAPSSVDDPRANIRLDPGIRAPHTDEASIGIDRDLGGVTSIAVAYIRKDGTDFIGWTDIGGTYVDATRTLADGRVVAVQALVNRTADRVYLLTNPAGYGMTYNGLVVTVERRLSRGWQAKASYTWSRTVGLQASGATSAAGPQVSSVAPPPPATAFGRDPNDLTNARGRLPNDRPHVLRLMGTAPAVRLGVTLAADFQYFTGKPWAATARVSLPNGDRTILLEPRGSRRLRPQAMLNLRLSRGLGRSGGRRADFTLDILNVLNVSAAEGLTELYETETTLNPNFGQSTIYVDPRRAMVSVRIGLGGSAPRGAGRTGARP
jgi:hypothetical protein